MRKQQLIEVTFEKFAQKGYNTTLSEIADSAGIKKQSIYNHFENKDALIYETIKLELLYFYSTKSSEFDTYMHLDGRNALKSMFFSICDYYKDINKLKFWKWILLIDSESLFKRCRDLIRENQSVFYNRVFEILKREKQLSDKTDEILLAAVQTFVVMIQGVLEGMLLYQDVYDPHILIENTWNHYWMIIENRTVKS